MRVLLTGAAGFVGKHVHAELLQRGYEVHGIDCYIPQVHGDGPVEVEGVERLRVMDLVERWALKPSEKYDAVIHLAAEVGVGQSQFEPARYVGNNVSETALLWEAILKHKSEVQSVVVASSMSIYGEGSYKDKYGRWYEGGVRRAFTPYRDPPRWNLFLDERDNGIALWPIPTPERKRPEPSSVYALTKYDTEMYSLLLGEAHKIPTAALRFFNILGEGQAPSNPYTGVAVNFGTMVRNGHDPLVFEDGKQARDFIHVDDVARAVCDALGHQGTYNVCTGVPTTVLKVAEMWCDWARNHGIEVYPNVTGKFRSGDIRACIGDHDAFTAETGWKPKVPFEDAFQRLAEWLWSLPGEKVVDHNPEMLAELRGQGLVDV